MLIWSFDSNSDNCLGVKGNYVWDLGGMEEIKGFKREGDRVSDGEIGIESIKIINTNLIILY